MAIIPLSPTCLTVVNPDFKVINACLAARIALVSFSIFEGLSAFD